MRAFKIWNKTRTSSFNLSGLSVITTNVAGLGNKFTNDLYDSRIKKHLISQTNSFEQINLTVNFGVHSNAYQKYREFMNFIQANGRNILVIEYYTPGTSRFVDVVLSNASKNQKTGFGVLVETVSFDRLTPYYILQRRTGRSVLVSNSYLENVVPRLELKNDLYPAGTKIRLKSKNENTPKLSTAADLGGGNYRLYSANGLTISYNVYNSIITINGTPTIVIDYNFTGIFEPSAPPNIYFYHYVGGSANFTNFSLYTSPYNPNNVLTINSSIYMNSNYKVLPLELNSVVLQFRNGETFNNLQFKLQLEKAGNNLELDRTREEFNGKTLREFIEDNQLITNGDFSNGTTGWTVRGNTVQKVVNGVNSITATADGTTIGIDQLLNYSNQLYAMIKYRSQSTNTIFLGDGNGGITTVANTWTVFSKIILYATNNTFRIYQNMFAGQKLKVDYLYVFEVGALKMGRQYSPIYNKTFDQMTDAEIKNQMDVWLNEYLTLKETPTEYSKPIITTQEIELNESILSNQELIIDSENKTVTLNGANAYQITNKDKSTFLNLPEGDYLVECDTPITVEYKRWVID